MFYYQPEAPPEIKTSVLHLNARSLKGDLYELEALLYCTESPPFILSSSETWLTEKDDCKCCLVDGYNHFVTYRRKTRGCRVMIQIRSDFIFLKSMEGRRKQCSKN